MSFLPAGHLVGAGLLDLLIELGLPVVILVVLWAWSKRAEPERPERQEEREDET